MGSGGVRHPAFVTTAASEDRLPETPPTVASSPASTAWISWLRFVAITGVVTIHSVGGTAAMAGARDTLRGKLAILLDIGAIFAVPVFVMISGALVLDPARYRGPRDFLRKRIW